MRNPTRLLGWAAVAYAVLWSPLTSEMISLGTIHSVLRSPWAVIIPLLSRAAYIVTGVAVIVGAWWGLGALRTVACASGLVALVAAAKGMLSVLADKEAIASMLFLVFGVLPHALLFGFASTLRRSGRIPRGEFERSVNSSPSPPRHLRGLALAVIAVGLLVPPVMGLVVRVYLQHLGRPVLEWSEIFSVSFLIISVIMVAWAATPFGGLAAVLWFWCRHSPSRTDARVRFIAVGVGFLAAALADIAGYAEMWHTSDFLVGFAIPGMVFSAAAIGVLLGWLVARATVELRRVVGRDHTSG